MRLSTVQAFFCCMLPVTGKYMLRPYHQVHLLLPTQAPVILMTQPMKYVEKLSELSNAQAKPALLPSGQRRQNAQGKLEQEVSKLLVLCVHVYILLTRLMPVTEINV